MKIADLNQVTTQVWAMLLFLWLLPVLLGLACVCHDHEMRMAITGVACTAIPSGAFALLRNDQKKDVPPSVPPVP